MANVLFLGVPSHGHVNPTIGLVTELVARGETVTYFASEPFREKIEGAGATFRAYAEDLNLFRAPSASAPKDEVPAFYRIAGRGPAIVADLLEQTRGERFDYLIHSAAFPFTKPLAQILRLPTVSSLAVFAGLEEFLEAAEHPERSPFPESPQLKALYDEAARAMADAYGVAMPGSVFGMLFNVGDLNLVYTSRYFAGDLTSFDDTFKFVGPPVSDRKETVDFPFEQIDGKRTLYISLGTVFGDHAPQLYGVFFEAFADWDGVVVLAAYGVDRSAFEVPDNFVVRDYVPQNAVLKRADVAITHCGMNSMNDLLVYEVPFVSLPMGADQPAPAARAQELGATIVLDPATVDAATLRDAVERVRVDPSYRESARKLNESFKEAGGYPRAVDEIFRLKREKGGEG